MPYNKKGQKGTYEEKTVFILPWGLLVCLLATCYDYSFGTDLAFIILPAQFLSVLLIFAHKKIKKRVFVLDQKEIEKEKEAKKAKKLAKKQEKENRRKKKKGGEKEVVKEEKKESKEFTANYKKTNSFVEKLEKSRGGNLKISGNFVDRVGYKDRSGVFLKPQKRTNIGKIIEEKKSENFTDRVKNGKNLDFVDKIF